MPTQWTSHRASKLFPIVVAAAAALVPFVISGARAQEKPAVPEVVARVGGETVDRQALYEEAAASLEQVEAQRLSCQRDADRGEHQALEGAVERLVRKRLFALEAVRRGVTEDALREEIRAKANEVSDADVEEFYQQNQSRINQPKENVAEQIRNFIRQQRLQTAEQDFFASIEDTFEVDILLEPLRMEVATAGAPDKGPETAPVTIVEFSDFECPYCKRVLPTLEQIEEKYGEQVRVVYRHYPLSNHPNAQKAAEASLCANDQGKFWEMHDLLFAEQQKLQVADLKEKAGRLELDATSFAECLDSGSHAETVHGDLRAGIAAGVDGTPAFFVNGRFISGAVPFETLAEVIDDEIRRKKRG
ncbi:MAG TPA: thioredoxin domain-containing protein [Thermoanaerobaculia bacterium]|nr:thioredoxin domain-containing protein [Thermoanaerobaculia bacterium]